METDWFAFKPMHVRRKLRIFVVFFKWKFTFKFVCFIY